MFYRDFGNTGLRISVLGFGAGHIGESSRDSREIETLLLSVLDCGVNFIDTARAYGCSEERIGRSLRSVRRDSYILSTKCGYGIEGTEDWTGPCITLGVDEALKKLNTDYIDVMHLHSCPIETLQRGEVIEALEQARQAGKVRFLAYSGENENLAHAMDCGRFDVLQTSVNLCDQWSLNNQLPKVLQTGHAIIAKRAIANAFWRFDEPPVGQYCETYWSRAQQMGLGTPESDISWLEFAVRFAAFAEYVSCAIAGTGNLSHFEDMVCAVQKGPLADSVAQRVRDSFREHGSNWQSEI